MITPEELEKKVQETIDGTRTVNYTPQGIIKYLTENPIEYDKLAEACSKAAEDFYKIE